MIPLKADSPSALRPIVTISLIVTAACVFLRRDVALFA
jgi:hypothetical protein